MLDSADDQGAAWRLPLTALTLLSGSPFFGLSLVRLVEKMRGLMGVMPGKRFTAGQIVAKLREAERLQG